MGNSLATQCTDWSSLVESARQGDDDAFGQICDRMTDYLLLTTRSLENGLSAKFGASDIVQQTLMEARRDITSFQGNSEKDLQVWLVQLVRNNLIDTTRRYRNTEKRDVSRESPKPSDTLAGDIPGLGKTASSIFCHQETDDEIPREGLQLAPDVLIHRGRSWPCLQGLLPGREDPIAIPGVRKQRPIIVALPISIAPANPSRFVDVIEQRKI